ncbi:MULTISPECIES: CHAT domain-containing protein [unclassified Streptomyces]|uniref:CHAT domain-containing protein n=1 Tax=unclassified Streptomyces TaxID=2593676 RepID=UPI0037F47A8A
MSESISAIDIVTRGVRRALRHGDTSAVFERPVVQAAAELSGQREPGVDVLMALNFYHRVRASVPVNIWKSRDVTGARETARHLLRISVDAGHPGFLDQETAYARVLLDLGAMTDEDAADRVRLVMGGLLDRFADHPVDITDLTRAVALGRRWRETGGVAVETLLTLAECLRRRFEATGSADDLGEAVETAETARGIAADGGGSVPFAADLLLGTLYVLRHQAHGAVPGDLTAARACLRSALETGATADERFEAVNMLAIALQLTFRASRELSHLYEAESMLERYARIAESQPRAASHRVLLTGNLGLIRLLMAEHTGSAEGAAAAVALLRSALALNPDDPAVRARLTTQLANAERTAAVLQGVAPDDVTLDRTVDRARGGVRDQNVPGAATAVQPGAAHLHLSQALTQRYVARGDLADLEEAEETMAEALGRTPESNRSYPLYLMARAVLATVRYLYAETDEADEDDEDEVDEDADGAAFPEESARVAALDRGIDDLREAVRRLPDGAPDSDIFLSNLARALQLRFQEDLSRSEILTEAIACAEEAVALGGERASAIGALVNLALLRVLMVDQVRNPWVTAPVGLEEALAAAYDAVRSAREATPDDHPAVANIEHIKGQLYAWTHLSDGDPGTLDRALTAYWSSASAKTGPLLIRTVAAQDGGELAARHGRWEKAADLYDLAVRLLEPLTEPSLLGWESRADQLERFTGIARRACAAHLRCGRLEAALQTLDRGRGVLLAPAWNLPSAVQRLSAEDAEGYRALLWSSFTEDSRTSADPASDGLAHRVPLHSSALAETAVPPKDTEGRTGSAQLRRKARDERGILSSPLFRQAHPDVDLAAVSRGVGTGAAVTLNVAPDRCDALVITARGVEAIPLPELSADDASEQAYRLFEALRTRDPGAVDVSYEIAEWLWDAVVGPVLDHLHASPGADTPTALLPRVWWIPTGPLCLLPVHAAGYHRQPGRPRTALDRVVSSYSATLRALARDLPRVTRPVGSALLVAPARAGGLGPAVVPAPVYEGRDALALTEENAARQPVLAGLPGRALAHFSCHGRAEPAAPEHSALHLADGPLRFFEIARLDLTEARLAFLAACETAWPGHQFEDEAIHLGSGFQLAGFPHVVGTVWEAYEAVAARVTHDFYEGLAAQGDAGSPAHALHDAVRRARAAQDASPVDLGLLAWAPYIHLGP